MNLPTTVVPEQRTLPKEVRCLISEEHRLDNPTAEERVLSKELAERVLEVIAYQSDVVEEEVSALVWHAENTIPVVAEAGKILQTLSLPPDTPEECVPILTARKNKYGALLEKVEKPRLQPEAKRSAIWLKTVFNSSHPLPLARIENHIVRHERYSSADQLKTILHNVENAVQPTNGMPQEEKLNRMELKTKFLQRLQDDFERKIILQHQQRSNDKSGSNQFELSTGNGGMSAIQHTEEGEETRDS